MQNPKRAALIILDGWGINNNAEVSAIEAANTPFMDGLMAKYPNSTLVTYGESVGLPEGQMGNSEVGHINIGAGRIVYQELARINKEIREGNFQKNKVLLETLDYAKNNNKKLHLFGLLSDGGVHSHLEHLKAICALTDEHGLDNVFIHLCLDGRDTDPKKGVEYLTDLQCFIKDKKVRIASLIGRYYAMDRDLRWERIKKAYDLYVHGIGEASTDPVQTLKDSYQIGITDEFIMPHFCADENGNPLAKIEDGDALICYNFRTDRCRQITMALTQQDYPEFNMYKIPLHFCTMTRYDEKFKGIDVVYEKEDLSDTIGEVLSKAGKTQIRIAETEKYPHVTFFFNGGREEPFPGEKRIIVPSPKVATYDLKPEMSAIEVTESISKELYESPPDFLCLNYANADMVGHTGVFTAAVKAVETVDDCLSKLVPILLEKNYDIIIIADHGNSDCMKNPDGSPNTAHTTNPVPCVYVSDLKNHFRLCNGKLADIAPTILEILKINKPESMSGENLIKFQ